MEVTQIANEIEKKINELELAKNMLKQRTKEKAGAVSEYDKSIAVNMLKLKESYPSGIIEKLARGNCYQAKYSMEIAETGYKSLITAINVMMAQLNGLQSINRHLDVK